MSLTAARNKDLIRALMLRLEAIPMLSLRPYCIEMNDPVVMVSGFSADEIAYHISLIRTAGFINTAGSLPMDGTLSFAGFTWEGCEFIDNVRDSEIWSKTKAAASKVGNTSLAILVELAKAEVKKQLGLAP